MPLASATAKSWRTWGARLRAAGVVQLQSCGLSPSVAVAVCAERSSGATAFTGLAVVLGKRVIPLALTAFLRVRAVRAATFRAAFFAMGRLPQRLYGNLRTDFSQRQERAVVVRQR